MYQFFGKEVFLSMKVFFLQDAIKSLSLSPFLYPCLSSLESCRGILRHFYHLLSRARPRFPRYPENNRDTF